MFFKVKYTLRDLGLAEGDTIEFSDANSQTSLEIRRPTANEEPLFREGECFAVLQTQQTVTTKVRPQFEIRDKPRPELRKIGMTVATRLQQYLEYILSVILWRRGAEWHKTILVNHLLQWSDDGRDWNGVPGSLRLRVSIGPGVEGMGKEVRDSIFQLVAAGAQQPIGHELYREAWHLRENQPRSSLLIGVAAAELGFKTLIGDLVPMAKWLALHAPTPPLDKMLTEYLPDLPARVLVEGSAPFIPKTILDVLKKGIRLRNEVAHAGGHVEIDTLREILLGVRDFLYLLDLYGGQEWAVQLISHSTRQAAKDEAEHKATGPGAAK